MAGTALALVEERVEDGQFEPLRLRMGNQGGDKCTEILDAWPSRQWRIDGRDLVGRQHISVHVNPEAIDRRFAHPLENAPRGRQVPARLYLGIGQVQHCR